MAYINNVGAVSYFEGQVADSNPYSLLSLANTGSISIQFGLAMALDGTNEGYKSPVASGDITNRMAVNCIINRNKNYYLDANLNPIIGGNTEVTVGNFAAGITSGFVAVLVEEAVNLGQPCFIRYAAGTGGTKLGAFRASADTSTAAAHPTWYYASKAAAGTIAIVRVS